MLVLNWDHTGISIVPGSSWTMELKGSQRVEIVGIREKCQITAVLCGSLTGDQLIYQGKTSACFSHIDFPDGWHVTCTLNWSNEKMKEYIWSIYIIVPYTRCKCIELNYHLTTLHRQYLMCSKASRRETFLQKKISMPHMSQPTAQTVCNLRIQV